MSWVTQQGALTISPKSVSVHQHCQHQPLLFLPLPFFPPAVDVLPGDTQALLPRLPSQFACAQLFPQVHFPAVGVSLKGFNLAFLHVGLLAAGAGAGGGGGGGGGVGVGGVGVGGVGAFPPPDEPPFIASAHASLTL